MSLSRRQFLQGLGVVGMTGLGYLLGSRDERLGQSYLPNVEDSLRLNKLAQLIPIYADLTSYRTKYGATTYPFVLSDIEMVSSLFASERDRELYRYGWGTQIVSDQKVTAAQKKAQIIELSGFSDASRVRKGLLALANNYPGLMLAIPDYLENGQNSDGSGGYSPAKDKMLVPDLSIQTDYIKTNWATFIGFCANYFEGQAMDRNVIARIKPFITMDQLTDLIRVAGHSAEEILINLSKQPDEFIYRPMQLLNRGGLFALKPNEKGYIAIFLTLPEISDSLDYKPDNPSNSQPVMAGAYRIADLARLNGVYTLLSMVTPDGKFTSEDLQPANKILKVL